MSRKSLALIVFTATFIISSMLPKYESKAAGSSPEWGRKSKGRIVFEDTNGSTPFVFDASDFDILYDICK